MRKNVELNNVTYYGVTKIRTVENGEETYWVPEGNESGSGREEINFQDKSIDVYYEDLSEGKIVISPDSGYNGFSDVVFKTDINEVSFQNKSVNISNDLFNDGRITINVDNGYDGFENVVFKVNTREGSFDNEISVYKSIIDRTISGELCLSGLSCVGSFAFYNCNRLTGVSFPNCIRIESAAFMSCENLIYADFPNVTAIEVSHAFGYCYNLKSISFPNCVLIGWGAFGDCDILAVDLPHCEILGLGAFNNNSHLSIVSIPMCSIITTVAFGYCNNLRSITLPCCTTIQSLAFTDCYRLSALYLTGSSVIRLDQTNAFKDTPMADYTTETSGQYGSIYVPSSLYSQYISAPNWSYYSSRFVSI